MNKKRHVFEQAMKFFTEDGTVKPIDYIDLSVEVATAVDSNVKFYDVSDISKIYDLHFVFSDGSVSAY